MERELVMYVLDASFVVKWFVEEEGTDKVKGGDNYAESQIYSGGVGGWAFIHISPGKKDSSSEYRNTDRGHFEKIG
jgi:hypothetical protein